MERESQQETPATAPGDTREVTYAAMPRCPNCGWQNVRLSHNKGVLDTLLGIFSVSPFRCRSCGARFHRVRRRSAEN
jgi:predicted RNA-binding Zn-ribbon protein involved in translation (DUF1610 family)